MEVGPEWVYLKRVNLQLEQQVQRENGWCMNEGVGGDGDQGAGKAVPYLVATDEVPLGVGGCILQVVSARSMQGRKALDLSGRGGKDCLWVCMCVCAWCFGGLQQRATKLKTKTEKEPSKRGLEVRTDQE